MKCFVYRNLHRPGYYSIKALEGVHKGKVLGWAPEMYIDKPFFKVSERGRQRVLRERRKNVHAGVVGEVCNLRGFIPNINDEVSQKIQYVQLYMSMSQDPARVIYNPYKYKHFVFADSKKPIERAYVAKLGHYGLFVYY